MKKRRKGALITSKNNIGKSRKIKLNYIFNCKKCNKEYSLKLTETKFLNGDYRKFCSRTCANSRIISEEIKQRISNKLSKPKEYIICKDCGITLLKNKNKTGYCNICVHKHYKDFLSNEGKLKLRNAGLKSCQKQKETRRSKNEISFCELCKHYFNNVKHNESIFNGWDADVIIEDYKIAVLWNGPWHYRKITKNHSVKQVQNRDKIKIEEIKNSGYVPYIVKDDGKYNKNKVEIEFNLLLENVLSRDSLMGRYQVRLLGTAILVLST